MRLRAVLLACGSMVAVAMVLPFSPANAGSISTLFNTGVDSTGKALADGAIDNHYTMTSAPSDAYTGVRVSPNSGGNTGAKNAGMDSTKSQFIGPNSNSNSDGPNGSYTYRTSFTLDSKFFSTASITGTWSADDVGSQILLNGVSIGTIAQPAWYNTATFQITSGFKAGINTLDFVVNNTGGGATGLRVAYVSSVPEPASILLVASGIAGTLALTRKRLRARRGSATVS